MIKVIALHGAMLAGVAYICLTWNLWDLSAQLVDMLL